MNTKNSESNNNNKLDVISNNGLKAFIEYNQSVKSNTELLDTFQKTFPQFIDAKGNFKTDKLLDELKKNNIAETRDGYKLGFVGKDYARLQTGCKPETMIAPDINHNSKKENINSGNIFITGDNIEALRHLQNAYAGKIKMIYIDPPYNTGKEFVYNDTFEFDDEKLKSLLGYGEDEIKRLKLIQGKSSHSAWLTFMYPRLKLAQKLLTDDGVIFISIDDNEQANLKLLMDDIFGEGNFIAKLLIYSNPRGRSLDKMVAKTCDYCIAYAKDIRQLDGFSIDKSESGLSEYDKVDSCGKYREMRLMNGDHRFTRENRPNLWYPIYVNPSNGQCNLERTKEYSVEVYPINSTNAEKCWTWSKNKFCQDNNLIVGKQINSGEWRVYRKDYLNATSSKTKPKALLNDKGFNNENATEEVKKLFEGKQIFDFPKPTYLVKFLTKICPQTFDNLEYANEALNTNNNMDIENCDCPNTLLSRNPFQNNNAIILDFFAGSGTTAHAVMQQNAEDNGNRKFILVQIDESTNPDSEARKAGYNTIDEIARERVKRAAKKIESEKGLALPENFDGGFKHYRIVEPDVTTLDKIVTFDPEQEQQEDFFDNMVTQFDNKITGAKGEEVILQTWLIHDGYTFDQQPEAINFDGYQAYYIDQSLLYIIRQGWGNKQTKKLLNDVGT
ncbi:MAG: site-specific DNA-methyltransferase, partial [Planctomycetaceae bacterium]|nr:site-specific DNA-methyltransferase [Planctomycetaceae bacterium]